MCGICPRLQRRARSGLAPDSLFIRDYGHLNTSMYIVPLLTVEVKIQDDRRVDCAGNGDYAKK